MKISIVTATYNRKHLLERLYHSILENSYDYDHIEWLIMDDGSTESIDDMVEEWKSNVNFPIFLFHQKNKGKMAAINSLIPRTTGDVIIEMDDDDYFVSSVFSDIVLEHKKIMDDENIYGVIYEKKLTKNNRKIPASFSKKVYRLYDLHYKKNADFDMALTFKGDYRRLFSYELEHEEKFITEARMYYKMDQGMKGFLICDDSIMICEYQEDGYTKGIEKLFKKNPYGYYAFFREVFSYSQKGILFSKRLYNLKHFILFGYLTKKKFFEMVRIPRGINRVLFLLLYLPGRLVSKRKFGEVS